MGEGRHGWDAPGLPDSPLSPWRSSPDAIPQPRGARRPLDRAAPQEGDPRLVRLRHPRHRARRHGRAARRSPTRTWATASPSAATRSSRPPASPTSTGETVLVQGKDGLKVGDQRFTAAVDDVVAHARADEGRRRRSRTRSPRATRATSPTTAARCSSTSSCPATRTRPRTGVDGPLAAVADAPEGTTPRSQLGEFGDASAEKEIGEAFEEDFQKAEFLSLPITLLILLIAFGALVAAGLPLLLGFTAVLGTIGLLGPISQLHALDESVVERRAARRPRRRRRLLACSTSAARWRNAMPAAAPEAALEAAAATSGRAVLISGLTVMAAMAGMFLAGNAVFVSFGIGTILVVAVADDRLGHRAPGDALVPVAQGLDGEGPRAVGRQAAPQDDAASPASGARSSTACSSARCSPRCWPAACSSRCRSPRSRCTRSTRASTGLPRDLEVMQTYDKIQAAFPGGERPGGHRRQGRRRHHARGQGARSPTCRSEAIATGELDEPIDVEVNPDKTVATVSLGVKGTGTDDGVRALARGPARRRDPRDGRASCRSAEVA